MQTVTESAVFIELDKLISSSCDYVILLGRAKFATIAWDKQEHTKFTFSFLSFL